MPNEFADMPPLKYRVHVELYPVDEPETVILKEDGPGDTPDDIEGVAAVVARRSRSAIINYEANKQ
jgi:hypothetical protein